MKCRICQNIEGEEVLDLGFHPLADTFLTREQLDEPETLYPLKIQLCPRCGLVQSQFVIPAEIRYQKNPYSFDSSSSNTARQHFASLAKDISTLLRLPDSRLVVDIGSNIGTLLQAFKALGYRAVGVEPSGNIAKIAADNGIETVNDFINLKTAREIVARRGNAAVVTATGVFNHIDDIYGLMQAVEILLEKGGVLVIEVPYLLDLVEKTEFDTIYHEHVSYYSIKPLRTFFSGLGYELFHVERIGYLGGSIRIFVGRKSEYNPGQSVDELEKLELSKKLHSTQTLRRFAGDVYKMRDELIWMLSEMKKNGKKIVGIGAPTKGNTLLNFCKIGTNMLDYVTENSLLKIGKYTPGMHIPIVADSRVYESKPDYALLLPWNLRDEIVKKFSEYTNNGGKIIIPVPELQMIP